jgi:L-amino acid N-acyltransferase YncA
VAARGLLVRPATSGDLDAVAAIFGHYVIASVATFEEIPPTTADWHRRLGELADRGLPFLVADVDGEPAGFAYASPWRPKPAYSRTAEDTIYLAPQWTGKGLGRPLLDALLTRCAQADVRQVVAVIADTGDAASQALHRALGFTEAGLLRAVGFKHGRWVDTRLMQCDLAPGGR